MNEAAPLKDEHGNWIRRCEARDCNDRAVGRYWASGYACTKHRCWAKTE